MYDMAYVNGTRAALLGQEIAQSPTAGTEMLEHKKERNLQNLVFHCYLNSSAGTDAEARTHERLRQHRQTALFSLTLKAKYPRGDPVEDDDVKRSDRGARVQTKIPINGTRPR